MSRTKAYRQITRPAVRRAVHCRNRRCLRGRRRGPDDLSSALTALGRALRAHRRLAKLAPSFFDPAVRDREAENRAELRRWLAAWEPALAKAYGVEPRLPAATDELPPLPSPRIQRAVERHLAERAMWLAAADVALERYQRRQPHALMSLCRMARLLQLGLDFRRLACGLDSPNSLPAKLAYDYELTDLKRGYGHLLEPLAVKPDPGPLAGGADTLLPAVVNGAIAKDAATAGLCGPQSGDTRAAMSECQTEARCQAEVRPSPALPRCDAWSRWARIQRRMKT